MIVADALSYIRKDFLGGGWMHSAAGDADWRPSNLSTTHRHLRAGVLSPARGGWPRGDGDS